MAKCYAGDNPLTDEERISVWRWVAKNYIDHGAPYETIKAAVKTKLGGAAFKDEWVDDILSGRKTPFRFVSDRAWAAQYYRRQATLHAQELVNGRMPSQLKSFKTVADFPRTAALWLHSVAFPITHAGDLLLRPESYPIFFRNWAKTISLPFRGKEGSAAFAEREWDRVKRDDLFELGLHSGVDLAERPHKADLASLGSLSEKSWSQLKVMRYELWKSKVEKMLHPDMTAAEKLDIGKNLGVWANHATGSAKGGLAALPKDILFGGKLTQSKLNRVIGDPYQTVKTVGRTINEHVLNSFMDWEKATPGEKAVAWTRLEGMSQYLVTYIGGLMVNQGLLAVTGQKDRDGKPTQINWQNPTKSDWLKFKGFGWESGLPGLHTELKALGTLLAVTFKQSKAVNPLNESVTQQWGETLWNWSKAKLDPRWQVASELLTGKGYPNKPIPLNMPWYKHDKVTWPGNAPYSSLTNIPGYPNLHGWEDYAISHGPILLSGPIRYVYDELKSQGMSAVNAMTLIKALIVGGIGATGMHIGQDYNAAKADAKQAQVARQLGH